MATDPTARDDTAQMVAWLREQTEERKRAAEAVTTGPWRAGTRSHGRPSAGEWDIDIVYQYSDESGYIHVDDPADAEHIALNDPAAVIADCDAKLRMIDECAPHWPEYLTVSDDFGAVDLAEKTIKHLAFAYRHRPGWREEWTL